ncbi:unnamed protein product [Rotaria magnacalcarata]|uniref:G-protein coupled receptors family 1 profile domain-containing protein n=1 Tax=Rotaria magnacalcarata TaxID=392030 RepID=A0A819C6V0_9BILA|nr:unnamed protein product [Rotaria magnacalcarata]CAF3807696.1 unnamed protein product [Rotaria magnacalcarata]
MSSYLNENRCLFGVCICPKTYYISQHSNIIHNGSLTLPMIGAILYDLPSLRYVYCFIFICLALIGLINNIFSIMTFIRERIQYTICGVYLIFYSLFSLLLMILIMTNVIIAVYYDKYIFRLWACYGYPYLSTVTVYISMLISSIIVIEHVCHLYFNFDPFRSRKQPVQITLLFLLLISISNLDKIFGRTLSIDEVGYYSCSYKDFSYKYWSNILYYIYIIIPCFIHFTCLICILLILIKRHSLRKIILYQRYITPSVFIMVCMTLNSLYLYLFDFHLTYSSGYLIRLHIGFIFLLYTPQLFTYMIYVMPNDFYLKEFYQIWFYRKLCCCFYNKKRHVQDFEVLQFLWTKRASLENIKTISGFGDILIPSEFYNKI